MPLVIDPASRTRDSRLPYHGLLNIDKPAGLSSRDVVNRVQRLIQKTKIGHAGTLDPLATGVLVVCLGAATRLVERVQDDAKGYRAQLRLGVRSDTDDSTGVIVPGGDVREISAADLHALLPEFVGDISQVPPKFSAVHVDGQRAYDKARSQHEFELAARTVHVDSISLTGFTAEIAELDIVCGSGTYIRSIIRDLGERLGCGAIMTSLRRTFIGPYHVSNALPLDAISSETIATHLLPMSSVLGDDSRYRANEAECAALLQGKSITVPGDFAADRPIAVLDPSGELFAFATLDAAGRVLQPQKVFMR